MSSLDQGFDQTNEQYLSGSKQINKKKASLSSLFPLSSLSSILFSPLLFLLSVFCLSVSVSLHLCVRLSVCLSSLPYLFLLGLESLDGVGQILIYQGSFALSPAGIMGFQHFGQITNRAYFFFLCKETDSDRSKRITLTTKLYIAKKGWVNETPI